MLSISIDSILLFKIQKPEWSTIKYVIHKIQYWEGHLYKYAFGAKYSCVTDKFIVVFVYMKKIIVIMGKYFINVLCIIISMASSYCFDKCIINY